MRSRSRAVVIDFDAAPDPAALEDAARTLRAAARAVAFSGAGISVESGIPDFRSPGGLWTRYPPDEYATLDAFVDTPEKAWTLFREMGRTIAAAAPNPAHDALARLEAAGRLEGVVTQNIDGLHQAAGSRNVVEVHGDHRTLHCIFCHHREPLGEALLDGDGVPGCPVCRHPLKPNVVLFGEGVRALDEIARLVAGCDVLLVVGTSVQVYPSAGIPAAVKSEGGRIFEFNTEATALTAGEALGLLWGGPAAGLTDVFFKGSAGTALPAFADAVLAEPGDPPTTR